MSLSNTVRKQLLDAFFGGETLSPPASVFVGLSSSAPTKTGGNVTEPSTGGYTRIEVVNTGGSQQWVAATEADPSVKENAAEITFPQSTGAWLSGDPLTHFTIYSAASGGNYIAGGELNTARSVDAEGITLRFEAGELKIEAE